jgi:putative flavoprotein involved in K+ transport
MEIRDCIIIGGGQCGLVSGAILERKDIDYLIVEQNNNVGDLWRSRPERLTLFTSRRFCQLPGLELQGDPEGYPDKNEIADYLDDYVAKNELKVRLRTKIVNVVFDGKIFELLFEDGSKAQCRTLINATGSNQVPIIPKVATRLHYSSFQTTCADYGSEEELPSGSVLVVGDGASGRQIALELSGTHEVSIATGRRRKLMPNRILGKDLFWWLSGLGIIFADKFSLVAKALQKKDPIPCRNANNKKLAQNNVRILPKFVDVQEKSILFSDGSSASFDTVIWCMGYKDDTSWLKIPEAIDEQKGFIEQYGETPVPGMYVVGRKWLRNRASELILGAEADAEHICKKVETHLNSIKYCKEENHERLEKVPV